MTFDTSSAIVAMARLEDSPVTSKPSPKSPSQGGESEKSKKYDRQLRLWGETGQTAIESSHVCLINATCTGVEILKNLILPGIGSFTIVDDAIVTGTHVGSNFFLTQSCIGSNRGKVTSRLLNELNPDVRGDYVEESLEQLLDSSHHHHDIFSTYTLVIACDLMNEDSLLQLSKILWDRDIPLIVVKTNGLYGYVRLQVKEHDIVESHPDSVLEDLRLDSPFPELKSFLDSQDLDQMNRKELSHTPSLVVMYKFLKKWQSVNGLSGDCLPSNSKEKDQLKSLIRNSMVELKASMTKEEESDLDLINFEESIRGLNTGLVSCKKIPSGCQELLNASSSAPLKNKFWLMVRALRKFVESKGCLPIRGTIPDMTSDSNRYISLQRIYGNKFREDVTFFTSCLLSVLEQNQFVSIEDFHENEIKTFCKNSQFLKVIRTLPLVKEYPSKDDTTSNIRDDTTVNIRDDTTSNVRDDTTSNIRDDTTSSTNGGSSKVSMKQLITAEDLSCDIESSLNLYLMFRSVDRFKRRFNRDPGSSSDNSTDEDVIQLKTCFKELLSEEFHVNNVSMGTREELLQQMASFGGAEVHAVSSIVGAIAAHEAIKLITHQFVPIDSTLIFDGINCCTEYVNLP